MNNMLKATLFILLSIPLFATNTITICGTGDSQVLLKDLASAYEKKNPQIHIVVPNSIGSGGGIKRTFEGKCDLGRVARKIKKSEKKYGLKSIAFANSPVVFIVNPTVGKIENITTKNILDIYSGTVKKWENINKTLNGKIYVARRETGDSSTAILSEKIEGFKDIKRFAGKILFTTQSTANILKKYKNSIGYLPLSVAKERKLNILKYNGVAPTIKNIQQGSYPIVLTFELVYKGELHHISKDFIGFIKTKEGSRIIKQHGAVPIETKRDNKL